MSDRSSGQWPQRTQGNRRSVDGVEELGAGIDQRVSRHQESFFSRLSNGSIIMMKTHLHKLTGITGKIKEKNSLNLDNVESHGQEEQAQQT